MTLRAPTPRSRQEADHHIKHHLLHFLFLVLTSIDSSASRRWEVDGSKLVVPHRPSSPSPVDGNNSPLFTFSSHHHRFIITIITNTGSSSPSSQTQVHHHHHHKHRFIITIITNTGSSSPSTQTQAHLSVITNLSLVASFFSLEEKLHVFLLPNQSHAHIHRHHTNPNTQQSCSL